MVYKQEKKIVVSNEFIDIYRNMNVYNQVDKMNKLSKRELYLLLILSLDNHSDEDPVVIGNYLKFEKEFMEILDIQDDKETDNEVLLSLIKETGNDYIDTTNLFSENSEQIPNIYTKEEVRDIKLQKLGE